MKDVTAPGGRNNGNLSTQRFALPLTLSFAMLFAPIIGCSRSQETETGYAATEVGQAQQTDSDTGVWEYITETTSDGLTIVSEKCVAGTDMVLDATRTAWIWSSDQAADGWAWIAANAGDATAWASDTASRTWTVTKQTTGEFHLWVQTKTQNGIAWTRTAIPAAWKLARDGAGQAWVWIDEHKVELTAAAAVISVVAAGLIVAPEAVGPAVVRGAVSGVSSHAAAFLAALWLQTRDRDDLANLNGVSQELFMSIGHSVLSSCGLQMLEGTPIG
ncbi:MAG: hypothetical protein NXI04_14325 [Planctomycetaceae bacterium]|nr:hypothetical protein [Planctomycetaceae bacterium]